MLETLDFTINRHPYLCQKVDLKTCGPVALGLAVVQVIPHRQHKLSTETEKYQIHHEKTAGRSLSDIQVFNNSNPKPFKL